ncbi:effector-associated constant component EACC1 [Dactylosporangium sp. CS-033363]|uniref:effector-associated constant component EACC1 n=1 Tax=Dactylosporangium sp. CS-033363 TaxID=3239935 RepID=UPI003D8E4224
MGADAPHLAVVAKHDEFDPADEFWLDQVADLYQDLRNEIDGFQLQSADTPGTKGNVDSVIIALGSAGAFSAAVTCFKAWLARDKHRRIVVTVKSGDREEQVTLDGLDEAAIAKLTDAVAEQIRDPRWFGTEHS